MASNEYISITDTRANKARRNLRRVASLVALTALAGCGAAKTENVSSDAGPAVAQATATANPNHTPSAPHETHRANYNGSFSPLDHVIIDAPVQKGDKTAEDSAMHMLAAVQKDHPEVTEEMLRTALERGYASGVVLGHSEQEIMTEMGQQIPEDSTPITAQSPDEKFFGESLQFEFDAIPQSDEGNA
jgi:hypothetical protein